VTGQAGGSARGRSGDERWQQAGSAQVRPTAALPAEADASEGEPDASVRALTRRQRSGLVAALREAAGASGRIVSLVVAGVGLESQGGAHYRLTLLAGVAAGVLWWVLVHAVALLLDAPGRCRRRRRCPSSPDGRARPDRTDRAEAPR